MTGAGDPRMDKAVAAKRSNPKMSLLDALLHGGFTFADRTEGQKDTEVLDSNDITLKQRKNQLNRRLRNLRNKGNTNAIIQKGRKSDPRMDKAVAARLLNPELSPYEALLDGGFTFPDRIEGQKDKEVLDSNGITLKQRKNQLNRRLRHLQKTENPNARREDPRMDKAVAARLLNPELSPYEALLDGGFKFPEGAGERKGQEKGHNDFTIFDSDGVTLGQLKYKLSAHLQYIKNKLSEIDDDMLDEAAPTTDEVDDDMLA